MQGIPLTFFMKRGKIMKRNWIDKFIYSITEKPRHYVEVKNPPKTTPQKLMHPQDARQMQYNRWSKRYKIYSGSYLPENDRRLLTKGWEDKKSLKNGGSIMQRKSSGQTIRSETHGQLHHYHWLNFWEKPFVNSKHRKFKEKEFSQQKVYFNKFGELTNQKDPEHHLYGDKKDD